MSGHTKTHRIESQQTILYMEYEDAVYQFPTKVAKKYRIPKKNITEEDLFGELDKKYTKAGVLLQGIRAREALTQIQMAKKLKVTQSDISQMEHGKRKVSLAMAKRIQKLFGTHYESFLSTEK